MKKHSGKRSLWSTLLSVLVLGIIILLAVGTSRDDYPTLITDYLGSERYSETRYHDKVDINFLGNRDTYGRWQGMVRITHAALNNRDCFIEEVIMVNGKRWGLSKITREDGSVEYIKYKKDIKIDETEKSAHISMVDISAFQVLSNKYPWFLYSLNAFVFEHEYIEAYMDTLETLLGTYEFEDIDFNDFYQNVIDDLEWTVYDSVIDVNSEISFFQGLEELKNAELRLAVIDRYRTDGKSTYNIVKTTYPGYLRSINDAGVSDQDFEGFCQDLDSLMTGYGSLDLEDPFFNDSVDARIFRALEYIYETGESSSKAMPSLKSTANFNNSNDFKGIYSDLNSILKQIFLKSSPSDVLEVVGNLMLQHYNQGDIIKGAVREAYFIKKGVILVPIVTTEFSGNNSATSVTLNGYVLEDGGAVVSSRGIAWATFHNPTTNDNTESSGTGTGSFAVKLDGLTEGTTYYARTYATNSVGTAYGNCIYFTAGSSVGIDDNTEFTRNFIVYPNPASELTTFSFHVESSESVVLTIVDLKGQVVDQNDLGILPLGENRIELDLSGLKDGMYSCQLTNNGTIKGTRKLLIAR